MTEQEIKLAQEIEDLNHVIYGIVDICSYDDKDYYEKYEEIIDFLCEEGYV